MAIINTERKEMNETYQQLKSIERLTSLGGFIEDYFHQRARELVSGATIQLAKSQLEKGPGYLDRLMKLDKISHYLDRYKMIDKVPGEARSPLRDPSFRRWFVNQNTVSRDDQAEQDYKFWRRWNLDFSTKMILNELSDVENQVLKLYYGIDNGKEKDYREVAKVLGEGCDPRYVKYIVSLTKLELEGGNNCLENFENATRFFREQKMESCKEEE